MIAGTDKFWWPQIDAGQTRSVMLFFDKHPTSTQVLLFSVDGTQHAWESDQSARTNACGFNLTIDGNGRVGSNHCKSPS